MVPRLGKIYRKNIWKVCRGKRVWHRILKKYQVQKNQLAVLLLPTSNYECNYYLLAHLNAFLSTRGFKEAIIITEDPLMKKYACDLCPDVKEVYSIGEKNQEALIAFYSIRDFDYHFILGSLDGPGGRMQALRCLNLEGVTMERLVAVGIYHLYKFPHRKISTGYPLTSQQKEDLKDFLLVPKNTCKNTMCMV